MINWSINLLGDPCDLDELSKSLNTDFLVIEQIQHSKNNSDKKDSYRLKSELFNSIIDYEILLEKATEIVEWLNGASLLTLHSRLPITIASIERIIDDGKTELFISITDTIHLRDSFSYSTTDNNGHTIEVHMTDPISDWIKIAIQNTNVKKVLRLLGTKSFDWVGMYRIYEVIKNDVGGINNLVNHGWTTNKSIDRFKRTACSPNSIGDEARHGTQTTSAPTKPMSISEAKSLIENIIHNWLISKK